MPAGRVLTILGSASQSADRAARRMADSCDVSLSWALVNGLVWIPVLAVSIVATAANYGLIVRAMLEMAGTTYIGSFRAADLGSIFVVAIEVSMGTFLLEGLQLTRMSRTIGGLSRTARVKVAVAAAVVLLIMIGVEAGLAIVRDRLLQSDLATAAAIAGRSDALAETGDAWITTWTQVGMAVVLPVASAFCGLALQDVVYSLRAVLLRISAGFLAAVSGLLWALSVLRQRSPRRGGGAS
jgi:hypothetical protein